MTVRGLYYQAEVAKVPGIGKSESDYGKVQRQVLKLRREGRLSYHAIADESRWMRRPGTYDGWQDCLKWTAELYRKSLWADRAIEVEVWIEKTALAGVLYPVTEEYDVGLLPTGGYTSETFAFSAVNSLRYSDKTLVIYALYDFDRSGQHASASLREKAMRFGREFGVPVEFNELALSFEQVIDMDLPTREPKRLSPADKKWPYDIACELDAIPPDDLRAMVRDAIEQHLPKYELEQLKVIEAEERRQLLQFVGRDEEDE